MTLIDHKEAEESTVSKTEAQNFLKTAGLEPIAPKSKGALKKDADDMVSSHLYASSASKNRSTRLTSNCSINQSTDHIVEPYYSFFTVWWDVQLKYPDGTELQIHPPPPFLPGHNCFLEHSSDFIFPCEGALSFLLVSEQKIRGARSFFLQSAVVMWWYKF